MKKLLLFAVFSIFTFTFTLAQEFRIGVKGGLNLATFTGDALTAFDTRASFHIGGLVEIPISEKFLVQPELLYSEKGSNLDGFFGFGIKTRLNYLDVPVLAKYKIVKGLSTELGPVASILVKAEGVRDDESRDVSAFYKNFDFGIGGGATYRFSRGLFLSLRFTKGLLNINEPQAPDDNNSDSKVQNNVFQISAGYSF